MRPRNRQEQLERQRQRIIEDCVGPTGINTGYTSVEARLEKIRLARINRQTERRQADWKLDEEPVSVDPKHEAEYERRCRLGLAQG
jgi:hypothetical protein